MLDNVLASFGALKALGFDYREFKKRLNTFKPTWGRMEILHFSNLTIINDTYNSNPVSLKNAINTLALIEHPKKILILGDMLEMGDYSKRLHEEIGNQLNGKDFYMVVFVGKEMQHAYRTYTRNKLYFKTKQGFKNFIQNSKKLFQDGLILIKGSRGMRLEELIPALKEVSA